MKLELASLPGFATASARAVHMAEQAAAEGRPV